MKFDVKVVKEFLHKHKEVYTIRAFEQKENFTVTPVNNLGDCMKEKICKICAMGDLIPYVSKSGFRTAEDWYEQFQKFGHNEGWLYHITVLEA